MTIQDFITKAIEGGWKHPKQDCSFCEYPKGEILLDPEAWKAVGKVEGWPDDDPNTFAGTFGEWKQYRWLGRWHSMIDALAEGETIENYLETL